MQLKDFSRDGLRLLIPQADLLKMNLVRLKVYLPNKTLHLSVQGKNQVDASYRGLLGNRNEDEGY